MVTTALRTPFERLRNGWAWGFQSLKSPTTDTAPAGSVPGSTNVTRTVPARVGLSTLINCLLLPPHLGRVACLDAPPCARPHDAAPLCDHHVMGATRA